VGRRRAAAPRGPALLPRRPPGGRLVRRERERRAPRRGRMAGGPRGLGPDPAPRGRARPRRDGGGRPARAVRPAARRGLPDRGPLRAPARPGCVCTGRGRPAQAAPAHRGARRRDRARGAAVHRRAGPRAALHGQPDLPSVRRAGVPRRRAGLVGPRPRAPDAVPGDRRDRPRGRGDGRLPQDPGAGARLRVAAAAPRGRCTRRAAPGGAAPAHQRPGRTAGRGPSRDGERVRPAAGQPRAGLVLPAERDGVPGPRLRHAGRGVPRGRFRHADRVGAARRPRRDAAGPGRPGRRGA